ncbi:MAG: GYD domain-containing protein [Pirellulales bacterium]
MATYVATVKFTPQGVAAIKDTAKRANAFKSAAKKLGVKVTGIYWTLGPFDGLLLMEAEDEQSVTAAMLQLAAQGNVQTQTARAFNANEIDQIVSRMNK